MHTCVCGILQRELMIFWRSYDFHLLWKALLSTLQVYSMKFQVSYVGMKWLWPKVYKKNANSATEDHVTSCFSMLIKIIQWTLDKTIILLYFSCSNTPAHTSTSSVFSTIFLSCISYKNPFQLLVCNKTKYIAIHCMNFKSPETLTKVYHIFSKLLETVQKKELPNYSI